MSHHDYSLMRGGLVHRLLVAGGLLRRGVMLSRWLAIALVVVSTLPLLLLCLQADTLWSRDGGMGLLGDYATLSRLLIALPLLVVAAPHSDALLCTALRQLFRASLVHRRRRARFELLLTRLHRWRDAWSPELVCVLIAIAPAFLGGKTVSLLPGGEDWRLAGAGLTLAGLWYEWVALPLFRLMLLLWLWRLLLWTLLLARLPRSGLVLHGAHPDGAGGLAFLGLAQERFAVLALAGGVVLAGACVNHIQYVGESLVGMRHLLAGYVVAASVLLIVPLMMLSPAMLRAKRQTLYRFDALGNGTAAAFDRRWRTPGSSVPSAAQDSLLDHGDASALADFASVYQLAAGMSVVPLSRWNALYIVLHAAVPLCPLVLFAVPFDDLVSRLLHILV